MLRAAAGVLYLCCLFLSAVEGSYPKNVTEIIRDYGYV